MSTTASKAASTTAAASTKRLHVKQTHSCIGEPSGMRITMRGLGLKGPGSEVTVDNTPSFRGAIKKVIHLVTVKEVDAAPSKKAS